jgi:hypothetical protein
MDPILALKTTLALSVAFTLVSTAYALKSK